jgi:hypothetical protein
VSEAPIASATKSVCNHLPRFIAILLVVLGLNARQALVEFTELNDKLLEKGGVNAQARTAELKNHIDDLLNRHKIAPDLPLLDSAMRSGACKL